jgi:hypothetical protein
LFRCTDCRIAVCNDYGNLALHQISRKLRQFIQVHLRQLRLNDEVFPLHPAQLAERFPERVAGGPESPATGKKTNACGALWLLRFGGSTKKQEH